MPKFYFTYGLEGQPFVGGWSIVVAPDNYTARQIFRLIHPDKTPGFLNCADVYDEEQFRKTEMAGPKGNFGRRCHEVIALTITPIDEKE